MDVAILVLWLVVGVLVLASKKVFKVDYALVWICLITQLVSNCLK